jgi:hypothetical protein
MDVGRGIGEGSPINVSTLSSHPLKMGRKIGLVPSVAGSGMFILDSYFFVPRIQGQKGTGSRIRNREFKYFLPPKKIYTKLWEISMNRDVYPGSRIWIFSIPDSGFFHPGSRIRVSKKHLIPDPDQHCYSSTSFHPDQHCYSSTSFPFSLGGLGALHAEQADSAAIRNTDIGILQQP